MPCFFGALGPGEICGSLAGQRKGVCEGETEHVCVGVGRGVSCVNQPTQERIQKTVKQLRKTQDAFDAVLQCPSLELVCPDA